MNTGFVTLFLLISLSLAPDSESRIDLPYADAGLTEADAAEFLLDRFAFGPRPGEVEKVIALGLDVWLEQQLSNNLPDTALEARLSSLKSLALSSREILNTYPRVTRIRAQARREKAIVDIETMSQEEMAEKLREFSEEQGYLPQRKLLGELVAQNCFAPYTARINSPNC